MKILKLAFITQEITNGGAERVIVSLSNELVNRNINVDIISIYNKETTTYTLDDRVNVIKLKKIKSNLIEFFLRAIKLRKIFNENKYDVIISFTTQKNISTILASLFSKHKIIISERNAPKHDPKNKALRILRKILYNYADGYVFQTQGARDFFNDKIKKKSIIIYNPLVKNLPEYDFSSTKDIIITTARLEPEKNIEMSIKAFAMIAKNNPSIQYHIYGKGSEKEKLQFLINDLKMSNQIYLKGFSNNVFKELKTARLFLLTSNYEGVSNSLIEAVCMGVPTITTDHDPGGARNVITDRQNGFIVEKNNVSQLAEVMQIVLSDDSIARYISNQGIKSRDKFDIQIIVDQWLNYITSIIGISR